MPRNAIILNPSACHGRAKRKWPQIKRYLKELNYEFDFYETRKRMDEKRVTRKILEKGCDEIVVVGGDGSINYVADEIMRFYSSSGNIIDKAGDSSIVLSLIALGTGNDTKRTWRVYSKKERKNVEDLKTDCELLVEGDIKEIDMGKVNDNYFINHVGMGLDYYVVKNAENFKFVPLAFVLSVFYSISKEKPWHIKLEIDNKVKYEGNAWLVTACNGKYFGGGMKAAPDAELDDGFFDIILAKGIPKIKFVGNFSKANI